MTTNRFIWVALLMASFVISHQLAFGLGGDTTNAGWITPDLPFRAFGVAGNGTTLWVCGVDEGVAESTDGGAHWETKHSTPNGDLLLNIGFNGGSFGFAAGGGGLLLTTQDGGKTWVSHPRAPATILQISFADIDHGLIRTPDALLFTADGGATWSAVAGTNTAETLRAFPYTFSLVALDSARMAAMVKVGTAQYEAQAFLVTDDGGKSWQRIDIPNSTLYSFFASRGEYWAVGTEVIHKEQKGGGYGVPVAWHSTDGSKWTRSINDLSACGPEMCVACTKQGCLANDRTITNFVDGPTNYLTVPSNPKLTPKWAATQTAMCFLGPELECSDAASAVAPAASEKPVPATVSVGPIGANKSEGPQCIFCEIDKMIVDPKIQGPYMIKLSLHIATNGTVTAVESDGAPTPEIRSRIEKQAQQWIFEPYISDGARVKLNLNTRIQIFVIRSR